MADYFAQVISTIMERIRSLEQLQGGTYSHNQLLNGGMEKWSLGPGPFTVAGIGPDSWTIELGAGSSIVVAKDTAHFASTASATCMEVITNGPAPSDLYQIITGPFLGTPLAFSARIRCNTPNAFQIGINSTFSKAHAGTNTYETMTLVFTPITLPIIIRLWFQAPCTAYIDNLMVVQGSAPIDYIYDALRG